MRNGFSLAIDIGGTFTDVILRHQDGALWVEKTLTTPDNLLSGFFNGVSRVLELASISPQSVDDIIVHATTIVTNAIIERKGARTAFVTTKGFKDTLLIRDEWRYDMFDLQLEYPRPVVDPELFFTVDERTFADGTVEKTVDTDEVARLATKLTAAGVEAVAVCLFNSFTNSQNERDIRRVLLEQAPRLFVSLSSEVAPQIREYLRASTTTVNAYVAPVIQPYLNKLSETLSDRGFQHRPLIMLSNGGIAGCGVAGAFPVRMIESGPAAGALAAGYYAERLGLNRLMSFDMGGTTAKACLIDDGKPAVSGLFEVDRFYRCKVGSGLPVTVPSIDLIEIGAGGGSIAWVDDLGLLKVGPRSAGAMPGPACYGRGGTAPTVTDANVVLGLLDAKSFLGGDMTLDFSAAHAQLEQLGARLGQSATEAAKGIFEVVSENMTFAARAYCTDKGEDSRGIPLFAFGGAGPVHACRVAELLDSSSILFPPNASVLSAFGTLVTPPRLDLVRSMLGRIDQLDWDMVQRHIHDMVEEATAALLGAGCSKSDIRMSFAADLRYQGQQNELTTELARDPSEARDPEEIRSTFEAIYQTNYGIALPNIAVEVVNWRLTATGLRKDRSALPRMGQRVAMPKGSRRVVLCEETVDVWDRSALPIGQVIKGPAIIQERETTIVILPRWRAEVHSTGTIIATRS